MSEHEKQSPSEDKENAAPAEESLDASGDGGGNSTRNLTDEGSQISDQPGMNPVLAGLSLIGIAVSIGGGIGALQAGRPFFALLILGGGIVVSMSLTEEGRDALQEIGEEFNNQNQQQQQQTATGGSGETKVCSECGWKNPQSNGFCHDCGSELD